MNASTAVFDRIVCGVENTPQSDEALDQAQCLLAPTGELHLVSVADVAVAVHAGWAASRVLDKIEVGARDALARAEEHALDAEAHLLEGEPVRGLLREIDLVDATLVALGTQGHSRTAGIIVGATSTTLLHEAPCAVLIARPSLTEGGFPASVVVGVDGSVHSHRALAAACDVADRFSIPLRVIAATGGRPISLDGLRDVDGLEWSERKPVDALIEASKSADLVVVGSRGLHGPAALGSVSERVAHRARSSVLVVRERD
ncbi:MAG TPA: universal stress protein [Gaiellaceae bacterium]|nr:universal stress protein [Gaiellaceae bacterium]